MLIGSVLAAGWALAMFTTAGQMAYMYLFVYLEFYLGPVTLVSLSLATMLGVVSTDRSVLTIRQRVVLQSSHRALGMLAVGSLVVHITTKIAAGRLSAIDAFIPFISGRGLDGVYIGMGTMAGYLMVFVLWTGIIRARFVGFGRPWMWRSLHNAVYVSWIFGIVHGLSAGRAAATWVTASYIACVVLVLILILVRLAASIGRKRKETGQTTGSLTPVGRPVQTGSESWTTLASAARRISGKERTPRTRESRDGRESVGGGLSAPDPLTDSWVRFGEARKADSPGGRRSNRFTVPEVPLTRPAAAARSAPEDPWDSRRRWAGDERPAAAGIRYEPAGEPAVDRRAESRNGSRRVAEEALTAGTRLTPRYVEEEEEAPVVRARRGWTPPYVEEEEEAPVVRARRGWTPPYVEEEDEAPVLRARHARSPRYVEEESPLADDMPTLVDLASRRARRAASEGGSQRSRRSRKANAEAVDEAYFRSLRGEAQ